MSGQDSATFVIDIKAVRKHFGEDFEFFNQSREYFISQLGTYMANIQKAVEAKSPSELEYSAHLFAGAIKHFYCEKMHAMVKEVEDAGKKGGELSEIDLKFIALGDAVNTFRGQLLKVSPQIFSTDNQ